MALHRKFDALQSLSSDIAVISECAHPERLRDRGLDLAALNIDVVWVGDNPNKGLAVLAFNGYRATLCDSHRPCHRYVAPVLVRGPRCCRLLAVWAQNWSAGITRKLQPGPLRLALRRYRDFLSTPPVMVAGDFNNNVLWDKPGWLMNHRHTVDTLAGHGLCSAYHRVSSEGQGGETIPTLYWRDRRKDGPTYHIDYIFMPREWIALTERMGIGTYEEWCGCGLSDHVPVWVDLAD